MKRLFPTILKNGIIAAIIFTAWDLMVIKLDWFNYTAGKYSYFFNIMMLTVLILVAIRDYNRRKDIEQVKSHRILMGIGISAVSALVYSGICILLYQYIFTTEVANAIKDKLFLLNEARTKMAGKSVADQDAYIAQEMNYFKKTFTTQGIFIFKGLITLFQGGLIGAVLGALITGKALFQNEG